MKKCTYCGKEHPDEATICELDEQPLIDPNAVTAPPKSYEIMPDGSKRFLKAAPFDIVFSILLPPYGFFVGLFALASKGEKKRGATMMVIGSCIIGAFITFVFMGAFASDYGVYRHVGDQLIPPQHEQLVDALVLILPMCWLILMLALLFFIKKRFRVRPQTQSPWGGGGLLALGLFSILFGVLTAVPGLLLSKRFRPFTRSASVGYFLCWLFLVLQILFIILMIFHHAA